MVKIYVEAVYFMTTTISTVGYGDINARGSDDPIWTIDMIYMIFVTAFGIMAFSSVTDYIFSYRNVESVQKKIFRRVKVIEKFLIELDPKRIDNLNEIFPLELIQTTKDHVQQLAKNSCRILLG